MLYAIQSDCLNAQPRDNKPATLDGDADTSNHELNVSTTNLLLR